jgi:hypothetical protein
MLGSPKTLALSGAQPLADLVLPINQNRASSATGPTGTMPPAIRADMFSPINSLPSDIDLERRPRCVHGVVD